MVVVSPIQSGSMQWDGGGGQLRDLVEVMVGQYGCADVLMVVTVPPFVVV